MDRAARGQSSRGSQAVIGFHKAKLPEPAAGMLSQYLAGGGQGGNLVGQATKAVEGFFHKN